MFRSLKIRAHLNIMKRNCLFIIAYLCVVFISCSRLDAQDGEKAGCAVGAFLADEPSLPDIQKFKNDFGRTPKIIMVFIDWERFVSPKIIEDVYSVDSTLFITWEPWRAVEKQGIDYDALLDGEWDGYIKEFAIRIKSIGRPVYLRFAHEMNGNWYPWSGTKIGKEKYIALYQHVKNIFDEAGADNIAWVFSVNWEDLPKADNYFWDYYPGDAYADYIGIDGYNWGTSQEWSRWMSFNEIFRQRYDEIVRMTDNPVLISEFSSTSSGGNKAQWIAGALKAIRHMPRVKGFVLFNVDKETDWAFLPDTDWAGALKVYLQDRYFTEGR